LPTLTTSTAIGAPIDRVFDLARDVDVHCRTTAFTQERAVGGKTCGLLDLGDIVTFEGVHFGIRQRLTARIVELDRPHRFADEMVSGPFRSLRHVHEFQTTDHGTLMTDTITWTSPLGPIGRSADLVIGRHLRRFLERRNGALKRIAELAWTTRRTT
jgi:ligand-binding SRPBCC domain-containing protein